MTAFAGAERTGPWGTLGCELRSVNHRFLEIGLRLPDELRALEPALRERIGTRVARGKLDLTMRLRAPESTGRLAIDAARVEELGALARALSAQFPDMRVGFAELLQLPGVLQSASVDATELHAQALALLDTVLDEFLAAREREGSTWAAASLAGVAGSGGMAGAVGAGRPAIRTGQRAKLDARLAGLAGSVALDSARVEQEFVLWLQKLDVDEELDRLQAHVSEARRVLGLREAVGRRLDFLLQEFNREANTLGSKSVDARSSAAAVELKVLIDQVREQVQNIE